ncbi:MAG: DUF881 domain-containing protein [Kineosporiaceae bacterium]
MNPSVLVRALRPLGARAVDAVRPDVSRPPSVRALDASMSLLRDIEAHPLDPGYAEAAARGRSRTTSARSRAVTLVLTAAVAGISVAAILALRAPDPGSEEARRQLVSRIERLSAKVAQAERDNAALRARLADAEAAVLGPTGAGDLRRWELLAGQRPVAGPGLTLTVDDAPGARDALPDGGGEGPAEGLVQDRDLQTVVNALWASGAEAVAVNGQRLTATSAIRSAGSAVMVDYRPVSPPYRVDAIGEAATLQSRFAAGDGGTYVQYLQNNFGILVTLQADQTVRLPAARAVVLHYARSVPARTEEARS